MEHIREKYLPKNEDKWHKLEELESLRWHVVRIVGFKRGLLSDLAFVHEIANQNHYRDEETAPGRDKWVERSDVNIQQILQVNVTYFVAGQFQIHVQVVLENRGLQRASPEVKPSAKLPTPILHVDDLEYELTQG